MKEEEANQILFLMSAVWTQPISDATLLVWKQRIQKEESYELAQEAISLLSDRCKFFPSIAELHETIRSLKRKPVFELDNPGAVLSQSETLSHISRARKELS